MTKQVIMAVVPWIFTAGALVYIHLAGRKHAACWIVSGLLQAACSVYNFVTEQYGYLPMNVIVTVLAVRNYRQWKREEEKVDRQACTCGAAA